MQKTVTNLTLDNQKTPIKISTLDDKHLDVEKYSKESYRKHDRIASEEHLRQWLYSWSILDR